MPISGAAPFRLPSYTTNGFTDDLSRLQQVVDEVYDTNSWTIILFHHIRPGDNAPYTVSSQDFASFLDYAQAKGIKFLTINQVLQLRVFVVQEYLLGPPLALASCFAALGLTRRHRKKPT